MTVVESITKYWCSDYIYVCVCMCTAYKNWKRIVDILELSLQKYMSFYNPPCIKGIFFPVIYPFLLMFFINILHLVLVKFVWLQMIALISYTVIPSIPCDFHMKTWHLLSWSPMRREQQFFSVTNYIIFKKCASQWKSIHLQMCVPHL